jgi:hypothetical protein
MPVSCFDSHWLLRTIIIVKVPLNASDVTLCRSGRNCHIYSYLLLVEQATDRGQEKGEKRKLVGAALSAWPGPVITINDIVQFSSILTLLGARYSAKASLLEYTAAASPVSAASPVETTQFPMVSTSPEEGRQWG